MRWTMCGCGRVNLQETSQRKVQVIWTVWQLEHDVEMEWHKEQKEKNVIQQTP